jgi:hypothetical protein
MFLSQECYVCWECQFGFFGFSCFSGFSSLSGLLGMLKCWDRLVLLDRRNRADAIMFYPIAP